MASTLLRDKDATWMKYLDSKHHEVPIGALSDETVKSLSSYLDMDMYSLDDDLQADYTGLAAMVGLNFGFVEGLRLLGVTMPAARVIREWQRDHYTREKPTIGNLVRSLLKLKRMDVISDCKHFISKDAEDYLSNQQESLLQPYDRVVRCSSEILTMDDTPAGRLALYDAFICWSECDEDFPFIEEMIKKLENPPFNIRLYVPSRNGLFGVNKYESDVKIMEERCKHVIVVLSPEYSSSEMSVFQASIAIALSAKDPSRHIVPILINDYSEDKILEVLRIRTVWNFSKQPEDSKWRQLAQSVCRFNFLQNI
uniref:TIR domain-containing protein n=1 Tax=Arion vulgaris TaxID=1028688 RepID=A0A0B7A4A0_9EUPU